LEFLFFLLAVILFSVNLAECLKAFLKRLMRVLIVVISLVRRPD